MVRGKEKYRKQEEEGKRTADKEKVARPLIPPVSVLFFRLTQTIRCLHMLAHLAHLLVTAALLTFTVAISKAERETGWHCPHGSGQGD